MDDYTPLDPTYLPAGLGDDDNKVSHEDWNSYVDLTFCYVRKIEDRDLFAVQGSSGKTDSLIINTLKSLIYGHWNIYPK